MKEIINTREYIEKSWDIVEDISIPSDTHSRFKASMLYSAFNICDAMQLLIEQRNFVSANILIRSLFEYLFRSYWLCQAASEENIDCAIKNDKWPNTKKIHKSIESKNDVIDLLASEKLRINEVLHSYTHGGNQNPISNISSSNIITPSPSDDDVNYLLNMVQVVSFIVVLEMSHLGKSENAEKQIMKLYADI